MFWGVFKSCTPRTFSKVCLKDLYSATGFPTPAAYAAFTGRGYSSYPGFGLASGIAGYPAGKSTQPFYNC
jgi:hypothetical protein